MKSALLTVPEPSSRIRYNIELETVSAVIEHGAEEVGRITDKQDDFRALRADRVMFVDVDCTDPRDALAKLRTFCAINLEVGFRVYRTRAGLRYLCTSGEYDPSSHETARVMAELGADAKYTRHIAAQHCFSARVTPKPERCAGKFAKFATCEFVWHEGNQAIDPKCVTIAKLHDSMTEAHSGKPLA